MFQRSYEDVSAAEFRSTMLPPLPSKNLDPEELEKNVTQTNRSRVSRMLAKVADADEKKKE